jgi:hypothetical protein
VQKYRLIRELERKKVQPSKIKKINFIKKNLSSERHGRFQLNLQRLGGHDLF